jgi:peptide/nickel transport system substrate-binding protein
MLRQTIAHFSVKERVVFMLSLVVFIIGIFSCIIILSNHFTVKTPQLGGTYREGIVGNPRFINPILAHSDADKDMTALIYSGLVRIGENNTIIPDLADSWEISQDGKTYTFHLKPNLVFHDGKPLTAEDVVFTVSKIGNPTLKSPLRVTWSGVLASAPDNSTVVFTLQKPYSGFIHQTTLGILPAHLWKNIEDTAWQTSDYNTEPIGSGPYKLAHVSRSHRGTPESFTLVSFKKFALGRPFIKKLVIMCLNNNDDLVDAYTKGDVDGISGIQPKEITAIGNENDIHQVVLPQIFGIFLNQTKNKAFSDPAVIKALNLAVDKEQIIDRVFLGHATSLNGPFPSSHEVVNDDYSVRKSLAIKTLENAGWRVNESTGLREKMFGKEKLVLTFTITTVNTPELELVANLVAQLYRDIGIHVDIKIFEIGTLNETIIRTRDFQALLFGQVVKHDTDLYAFWHSSQKAAPGLNISGYTNNRVDTLLESSLQESDPDKRQTIYTTIAQELAKDAPVVFLYTPHLTYLTNRHVTNVLLPTITDPSDRFSLVYQWYLITDRVWKSFVK